MEGREGRTSELEERGGWREAGGREREGRREGRREGGREEGKLFSEIVGNCTVA